MLLKLCEACQLMNPHLASSVGYSQAILNIRGDLNPAVVDWYFRPKNKGHLKQLFQKLFIISSPGQGKSKLRRT